MAAMSHEVSVVLHVDTDAPSMSTVSGRIESPFGDQLFVGWLDLLGQLEDVVDRARVDQPTDPRPRRDPPSDRE